MTQEEILDNLCYYDSRNPSRKNFLDMYGLEDEQDKTFEHHLDDKCYCDNCFHGRTQLAEYILTLIK